MLPAVLRLASKIIPALVLAALPLGALAQSTPANRDPARFEADGKIAAAADYGKLPLNFETNKGQADPQVKFLSRGNGYSLYLTDSSAVLALSKNAGSAAGVSSRIGCPILDGSCIAGKGGIGTHFDAKKIKTDIVRMELIGSAHGLRAAGANQLPGAANYFIGNDPAKWHSAVPTYARVKYDGVYPGVDLVYYGNQRQLEYDFIVAPNADPRPIRLHFAGAQKLKLNADGSLTIVASNGEIAFRKPVVYQEREGRRDPVNGSFVTLRGNSIGFALGSYDKSRPLIIDPILQYYTYLGASGSDRATGVAVDTAGNAYLTGYTYSLSFPTTAGAFNGSNPYTGLTSKSAVFVSKLNATGTALVYSTYLTGTATHCTVGTNAGALTQGDYGTGIAVDSTGEAFVTGATCASDFPTTSGAYQTTAPGIPHHANNAFITRLKAAGDGLIYSTYVGGSGAPYSGDWANAIAIDAAGNAYITGQTSSPNFPTTAGAFQSTNKNALGKNNAFVAKMNPSGTALVYSTYLGGTDNILDLLGFASGDSGSAIAVNSEGNAYVAGYTFSKDFPVTTGAYQATNKAYAMAGSNPFITELSADGESLAYSTLLGGSVSSLGGSLFNEAANGIALDADGDAYVAGVAYTTDFPTTTGAYQGTNPITVPYYGTGFVSKLNPTGTDLLYSTYMGGTGNLLAFIGDGIQAICLDPAGDAYLTGYAGSTDFPVTSNAYQRVNNAAGNNSYNAFLSELDTSGSSLVYSTYLGGTGRIHPSYGDEAYAAAYLKGNVVLAGATVSVDFPVTAGAYQPDNAATPGNTNAFIAKFFVAPPSNTALTADVNPQALGANVTFTAEVTLSIGTTVPTGAVAFSVDGGSTAATVPLDSTGHAAYGTSALPLGTHTIVASFSGDDYKPSSDKLVEIVHGPAAALSAAAGSGQTATYGSAFAQPLVVAVKDSTDNPVPGAVVSFSGPGIAFSSPTATTGPDGHASVTAVPIAINGLTATASIGVAVNTATFSLTGTPATLTVAAANESVALGDPIPALAYTIGGFKNGDTVGIVSGKPSVTTPASQSSPDGTYPSAITQGTLTAANYNFRFVNGTLTISSSGTGTSALQFIPVVPCRIADTRNGTGPFGGPSLSAASTREFDVPQSGCGIPSTAVAYSLNVTVVPAGPLGYLTLWPTGQAQPFVSTLNSDGRIKANAAITPAGANGGVDVFVSDATDIILDIDGYFVPSTTANALAFYPLTPCRISDTRNAAGRLGGPFIAAATSRSFPVQSSACNIPVTAQAYSLNVTAIPHARLDYLTTWPTGEAQPNVSTLNALTGTITANAAIVPAGNSASTGAVSIYVADDADVILDVNGYFAPPATGGLSLYTTTPCRVIDTRSISGVFNGVLPVAVGTSPCAPPAAAAAYVLNATVVPPDALTYLTLWPGGGAQPNVSTLNALDGAITSNMAIVPTTNGEVDAFSSNPTQLIFDISSYFAP